MKQHTAPIFSGVAVLLAAVAQFVIFEDSGWNAGLILLAVMLVLLNVVGYTRRVKRS